MPLAGQHQVADLDRPGGGVIGGDDHAEHRGIRRDVQQRCFLAGGMTCRDLLDGMIEELPLDRVIEAGEKILAGAVRGRTVIRVA